MTASAFEIAVANLLRFLGYADFHLERVPRGGNNQSYKVQADGRLFFLKVYHQDPEDPRKRGQTEFRWLQVLWQNGVRQIPEPLAFHEDLGSSLGLYGHLSGGPISTQDLTPDLIHQAGDFIQSINRVRQVTDCILLPPASEACFSLSEHWQTVARRVQRLDQILNELPIHAEAKRWVASELQPVWRRLQNRIPPGAEVLLPQAERILSPSDFGFHNALVGEDKKAHFLDFEYAGWDDPAKLVCDFFNQVAVPIPLEHLPQFVTKLEKMGFANLSERVRTLYPIYQIKWICILLNHFLPGDSRRKKFALPNLHEWETLLARQLQMANEKLQQINP